MRTPAAVMPALVRPGCAGLGGWPAFAAALTLAACGGGATPPAAAEPRALVVAVAGESGDSAARAMAAGLAAEVGHAISHARDLVVREPGAEVDRTVLVTLEPAGDRWAARWAISPPPPAEGAGGSASSADGAAGSCGPEEIPRLGRSLALDLLRALSSDADAAAGVAAAPLPSPPDAYGRLLALLGDPPGDGAGREPTLAWIRALEAVAAGVEAAPAASLALGSAYLELAGVMGGASEDYGLAGTHLSRALELDPALPAAREKLATYYTKLGRSEEARALLVEGIERHPLYAGFHDGLGYVLRYAGWMPESIEHYRRAQELDPRPGNLVATQDQITKSLIYLGRYEEALRSHERVESLLAEHGLPATEKEHFYKGVIQLLAGRPHEAVASFGAGRALDPNTIWSVFGEGYEGIALGDRRRVAEVLTRLEALDVVDGERRYRLVHLAAFLGDDRRGLAHLAAAIERGFFAVPYFERDPLTASLRAAPGFAETLEAARSRHTAFRGSPTRDGPRSTP